MYSLSVPVMLSAPTFDPEQILADLRVAGAGRIFLAIPPLSLNDCENQVLLAKLGDAIRFFKGAGIETGVWYWAFWVNGAEDFTPMTGLGGRISPTEKCPLDKNLLSFMENYTAAVAALHPDIILFDDDFRFCQEDYHCVCDNHLALMEEELGEPVTREGLLERMWSGGPNKWRTAFLHANGKAFLGFADRIRAAVDRVDPNVRLGVCACYSTFDTDGSADSFTVAHRLAGSTRPLVRLIGAPYWATNRSFGCRLSSVIELERMERAWYAGDDIEIITEGDTYPRPRYTTPASYLELFDSALRADGSTDGILKYMSDYTSSSSYEPGYLRAHLEGKALRDTAEALFRDGTPMGVRVWESMRKLEAADLSEYRIHSMFPSDLFFSRAARHMAENAIPTVWAGTGTLGIAYGENARSLPPEAFRNPLILDLPAARILHSLGHDVGFSRVGKAIIPRTEHFPAYDEYTRIYDDLALGELPAFARDLTLSPRAEVHSTWQTEDGGSYPAVYTYRNAGGERLIVLNLDSLIAPESTYRNHCRATQFGDLAAAMGTPLPVRAGGCPDLYLLCKRTPEGGTVLGLWNCFADPVHDLTLRFPTEYTALTAHACEAQLHGERVTLSYIPPFSYCMIELR